MARTAADGRHFGFVIGGFFTLVFLAGLVGHLFGSNSPARLHVPSNEAEPGSPLVANVRSIP